MGFWRSVLFGDNPVVDAALDQGESFAVDADSIDPAVFGLQSYVSPTSVVGRIGRREAEQVPAVRRARDLIAGSLGTLPLDLIGPDRRPVSSRLFSQPERDVPRSVTMGRTISDLFYEGLGWWLVTARDFEGYPAQIARLDPRSVDVQADGRVHNTAANHRGMSTEWPEDADLIRFDLLGDGILTTGARAIRTALLLDAASTRYAEGAPPLDYFTPSEGADPADDDEIREILDAWQEARQTRSTGYVPSALKYNLGGWNPEQLQLADARQHAVLEIARAAGIDPEDLGVSTTSRTYANQQDRRKAFLDFTLGVYQRAVEDRLSMGDVTKRGYLAKFNLSGFLRSDDLTRYQSYAAGLAVGAITPQQIADAEGNPTVNEPRPAAPAAPAPQEDNVRQLHAAQSFDSNDVTTFDAPVAPETFTVDREARVIRGLAVPYGTVSQDGRTFSFSKGSIQFSDPSRIKLLVGHDWNRAIGKATALEDTDAGLLATFKVARGVSGDEALSMAEDGVWDGLSVGLGKGIKTRLENGVQHVLPGGAQLREISQTPCPAYDGARITEVAASADTQEGSTMTDTQTEEKAGESVDFSALTKAIEDGFKAGFDLQNPQGDGPEVIKAGRATEVTEPSPYRFDGTQGDHSFSDDLRSYNSDPEARVRLEKFVDEAFAVTTSNTGTLNPTTNRPDLYVPHLQYTRPLYDLVSKGGITDKTPFTVPKFSSSGGLVADHTEGVEPTPGSFSATNQTISPAPVSGKIEINREVWDQGGSPQADAIIWAEMLNAYYEAVEAKIATLLASTGTAELNLAGATNDSLVDAMTGYFAGLQFVRGGNRFTATAADQKLFTALIGAKGSDGRKLLPVLGPANAQGTTSSDFSGVAVGSQSVRAAWALAQGANTRSYNFVPSSVWIWTNAPKKFMFEYQVKSIDMALWGYVGSAILRDSDVKPIDYDTSDS